MLENGNQSWVELPFLHSLIPCILKGDLVRGNPFSEVKLLCRSCVCLRVFMCVLLCVCVCCSLSTGILWSGLPGEVCVFERRELQPRQRSVCVPRRVDGPALQPESV